MHRIHRQAWAYFARYYRGRYRTIVLAFVLSIVQSVLILPIIALARHLIDVVIPARDNRSLVLLGCILGGLVVLNSTLGLVTRRMTLLLNTAIIKRLREDLIRRHYALSQSFLMKTDRSRLHTVILHDVGRIEVMGEVLVSTVVPSIFASFVLAGVLLYLNPVLFLVLLVLFPMLVVATQRTARKLQGRVDAFRKSFQSLSKRMWFVFWMSDLTRFQAAEKFEIARQGEGLREFRDRSVEMAWLQAAMSAMQRGMTGIFGLIVLVVGGMAVAAGSMSLGALISFYIALRLLQTYANPLLSAVGTVITGNESLGAIHELVSAGGESPYRGTRTFDFKGGVSLQDVSFRYNDGLVLDRVNVSLEPGETVVILGPNGAGKSTVASLVLGYYRPLHGSLTADGISYDEIDLPELRRQIGVVPQNPGTFSGTILENITYGYPEIPFDRVVQSSRQAGAHGFISKMPGGYQSLIGDSGVLISGGERQLIAISRALLRDPRLLILDEPTNHLGKEAVRALLKTIRDETGRRSTLIISHHWEIAQEADRIYYLEKGVLREIGSGELARLAAVLDASS